MLHHLLPYLGVSGILGKIRYITVHVAVNLDMLHHCIAVSLQAAVEVMQIVDSAHFPCRGVEKLCRDGLRQRIVTFLLPSGDKIVSLDGNHTVKLRNLVGTVLKVGVHRNHHITLRTAESRVERRRLAVIARKRHTVNGGVGLCERLDHTP